MENTPDDFPKDEPDDLDGQVEESVFEGGVVNTPDRIEPGSSHVVDVAIDEQTWRDLGTADPNSEEVATFMAQHGLKFGDNVALHIEGRDTPLIATTDPSDFFTTDRTLTAAAAERARVMIAPEQLSPEQEALDRELGDADFTLIGLEEPIPDEGGVVAAAPEQEAEVGKVEDAPEDVAEVVEDPERKKQEVFAKIYAVKAEHNHQVSLVMDEFGKVLGEVNKITIELESIKTTLDASLGILAEEVKAIETAVRKSRNGDWGNATAQKEISNIANKLPAIKSRFEGSALSVTQISTKKDGFSERLESINRQLDIKKADFQAEVERIRREQPDGRLPDGVDVSTDVSEAKQRVGAINEKLGPYLTGPAAMHDQLSSASEKVRTAIGVLDAIANGGEVANGEALTIATQLKTMIESGAVSTKDLLNTETKDLFEKELQQLRSETE